MRHTKKFEVQIWWLKNGGGADSVFGHRSLDHFHSWRVLEVARRVPTLRSRQLLAAPTHKGGWIDPRKLVQRMHANPLSIDAYPADFIQALLRLSPDHRQDALVEAAEITGEYGSALRYALGSAAEGDCANAPLWVAATRARAPLADDLWIDTRHPNHGPDAALAARYELNVTPTHIHVTRSPASAEQATLRYPTVLILNTHCRNWDSLVFPLTRESFFAMQVQNLGLFMESIGTYWQGEWGPLFDPDVALKPNALAVISLGLSLKNPATARLALDALIAGIDDGRIDGMRLGETLSRILESKIIKHARILKAFAECARLSPLHSQVIRLSLEHILGDFEAGARDPLHFMELLHELMQEAGESTSEGKTRAFLTQANGAGKAARLAKLILDPKVAPCTKRRPAAIHALKNRIERAERWQNWSVR